MFTGLVSASELNAWASREPHAVGPEHGTAGPTGLPVGFTGCCDRPVPGDLGLEVAEADPLQPPVEVHLGDRDRAPVLGLRDHFAGVVEDGRGHPIAGNMLVRAD